jgi:hypothetical protein
MLFGQKPKLTNPNQIWSLGTILLLFISDSIQQCQAETPHVQGWEWHSGGPFIIFCFFWQHCPNSDIWISGQHTNQRISSFWIHVKLNIKSNKEKHVSY